MVKRSNDALIRRGFQKLAGSREVCAAGLGVGTVRLDLRSHKTKIAVQMPPRAIITGPFQNNGLFRSKKSGTAAINNSAETNAKSRRFGMGCDFLRSLLRC